MAKIIHYRNKCIGCNSCVEQAPSRWSISDEDGKSANIIEKGGSPNTSFLGWPPALHDDYENYIKLTLSFKRDANPFTDKSLYIERFTNTIMERISQIKDEDSDQMDEINECLGFD